MHEKAQSNKKDKAHIRHTTYTEREGERMKRAGGDRCLHTNPTQMHAKQKIKIKKTWNELAHGTSYMNFISLPTDGNKAENTSCT